MLALSEIPILLRPAEELVIQTSFEMVGAISRMARAFQAIPMSSSNTIEYSISILIYVELRRGHD